MFCRVKPVITYFVFSPISRCNIFVFTGDVHATQKGIEVQDITLLAVKIGKGIITAKYFDKKNTCHGTFFEFERFHKRFEP